MLSNAKVNQNWTKTLSPSKTLPQNRKNAVRFILRQSKISNMKNTIKLKEKLPYWSWTWQPNISKRAARAGTTEAHLYSLSGIPFKHWANHSSTYRVPGADPWRLCAYYFSLCELRCTLSCWFRGPLSHVVLHPFWLVIFPPLLLQVPWPLRQGTWWRLRTLTLSPQKV